MRRVSLQIASLALLCASCATPLARTTSLDFFVTAPAEDPWNQKIESWQARHQQDGRARKPLEGSSLADSYAEFTGEMRRRLAAQTVEWVQGESQRHYRSDGAEDHWATLGEVIDRGSDDCDGLDLLTFVLLRRLGFAQDEIYRSILVERASGQHHMVTLWFDDRADPFVLDPTGVVARGMVRLSQIPGWEPIELFDEAAHFRVEPSSSTTSVAGR